MMANWRNRRTEPSILNTADLLAAVRAAYGLPVIAAAFLPVGNDAAAWLYKLAAGPEHYFLKVRQGDRHEAGLAVPYYLRAQGMPHIVAPLPTQAGALWAPLDAFHLSLYPFIEGRTGKQAGLSDEQWRVFGATLGALHATPLPAQLAAVVRRENFQPRWAATVAAVDQHIAAQPTGTAYAQALATMWRSRRDEIFALVARAQALGQQWQAAAPALVLCHADAHTDNVLVDDAQNIWLTDWDETLLAPKERDLMFVVSAGNRARSRTIQQFFDGYGPGEVDPLGLAYYRYEWAVQEIGDYAERLFLKPSSGWTERAALQGFMRLFEAGRDVAQAHQSEALLKTK